MDENLQPKLVYTTLDELINHEWKTHQTGLKPDKNGKISFRGFKGNYKITVQKNGKVMKEFIVTNEVNRNNITLEL